MYKIEALVRRCPAHFGMAMTWILTSQRRMTVRESTSDAPKFVTPMPDVKSSNFRPLCIVTHDPSPFANTSSVRWVKPFVTWRCAKSRSGTVVIERPLEHVGENDVRPTQTATVGKKRTTYSVPGTSARELRFVVRNSFCPSDIFLASEIGKRGNWWGSITRWENDKELSKTLGFGAFYRDTRCGVVCT
jgi:hypothetical protein